MVAIGHYYPSGDRSCFRVFAPEKLSVRVVLASGEAFDLAVDGWGWWSTEVRPLPEGTLYRFEVEGRLWPDPATRYQPQGVHGPSMVTTARRKTNSSWNGVSIDNAVIYELHVGTFTAGGTLASAMDRLDHLHELGITVIELMPLAAFPGERNWGYDGVCPFALHHTYGTYTDLQAFLDAAHDRGMAVILDVVYNHLGPEGNYTGLYAPYLKKADTPWGEAINFDDAWNHGVREYFLANTRYWLQEVGFDGFRMDAVSLIFDVMPVSILKQITDLARAIGREENREVLMIAEHLRNNKYVTSPTGMGFHSQWNDDLNHAVFAYLTKETGRHYQNFGRFDDVDKALSQGFVLDGTRLDKHYHYLLGTDGRTTHGGEHVVHMQNHDQVGNRARGDRMVATYGRAKALLAVTAMVASRFVPMVFMGEEYGETAPFWFFEDFGDPVLVNAVRQGRKAAFTSSGAEPPDPHSRATFEESRLRWDRLASSEGRATLTYYRELLGLKRSGLIGPHQLGQVTVDGDASTGLITLQTGGSLTILNLGEGTRSLSLGRGYRLVLASLPQPAPDKIAPFGALIFVPSDKEKAL